MAQWRFADLPGHDRFKEVEESKGRLAVGGRVEDLSWLRDGRGVEFRRGKERFTFIFAEGEVRPADDAVAAEGESSPRRPQGPRPARGRQLDRVRSPDGAWDAVCRDDDVLLEKVDGGIASVVTTDGHRKHGYGRASWVYGEELDQDTAMWWSPDSSRLAFYEFDDRKVPDYPLSVGWTALRPSLELESYPKPGDPNPIAAIRVHHLADGKLVSIDVGAEPDQYVYGVRWSPDGSSLLFLRTTRRQDVLELVAADPSTGVSRVVLTERQPTFQNNRPLLQFLEDGERFIWESEASGWANYELRHLDGRKLLDLTTGDVPVLGVVKVDEGGGWLYYTAASGAVKLDAQLHRVRLDGSDGARLTLDDLHHTRFEISPDHARFVCTSEAVDTPPSTGLYEISGARTAWLAESDTSRMVELGLPMPERFTFTAADGVTTLYGLLYKPRDFDPGKRYPLVVDVYGGPGVRTIHDRWEGARPECELGFLVAKLENRGTPERGKAFETATYLNLGIVDLDDQVAGVKSLTARPYVDPSRVGITGGSYGGYLSAMALLRYPEIFRAAVAVSAVTDWRNYDSIYTERYMQRPEENPDGYDAGSCVKLAETFEGSLADRLLIVHGMVDDNVHPNNAWQLVDVLQRRNIPFEMQFFPRANHGVGGEAAKGGRWGFLWQALVAPEASVPATPAADPIRESTPAPVSGRTSGPAPAR